MPRFKPTIPDGGDHNRIYVSGQSAGAHLAATTLIPGWNKDFNLPEDLVKGLIALSGIYDFDSLIQFPKTETQEILKLTFDEVRRFSPIYHPPKKAISSIIAYGDKEPFAYSVESIEYAKILQQAGCHVSLIVVPNANHFDMINELSNVAGEVFKVSMEMMKE
jgi:arylformamidase